MNKKLRKLNLRFKHRDNLIYYINLNNKRERLYVLNNLKKQVFKLAYNK